MEEGDAEGGAGAGVRGVLWGRGARAGEGGHWQRGGAREWVGEGLGGAVKWGLEAMPVGQGLQ
eukprot:37046-Rhodomonas_salina.1